IGRRPTPALFPYTTLFRSPSHVAGTPMVLDAVCLKALARRHADRFGSALDLRVALLEVAPTLGDGAEAALVALVDSEVQAPAPRSEEHTSELQSLTNIVCR